MSVLEENQAALRRTSVVSRASMAESEVSQATTTARTQGNNIQFLITLRSVYSAAVEYGTAFSSRCYRHCKIGLYHDFFKLNAFSFWSKAVSHHAQLRELRRFIIY